LAVGETVRVTIRNANKVEETFVDGQNIETTLSKKSRLSPRPQMAATFRPRSKHDGHTEGHGGQLGGYHVR
jgi:hypothetical protein